jgi:hypothetical protein
LRGLVTFTCNPSSADEVTLDDVFLDATGRTCERAEGEVQEVSA